MNLAALLFDVARLFPERPAVRDALAMGKHKDLGADVYAPAA